MKITTEALSSFQDLVSKQLDQFEFVYASFLLAGDSTHTFYLTYALMELQPVQHSSSSVKSMS